MAGIDWRLHCCRAGKEHIKLTASSAAAMASAVLKFAEADLQWSRLIICRSANMVTVIYNVRAMTSLYIHDCEGSEMQQSLSLEDD